MESRRDENLLYLSMVPLARTPLSKEGGRAVEKATKAITNTLYGFTPWEKQVDGLARVRGNLAKRGERSAVVIADSSENISSLLIQDVEVIRK